VRPGQAPDAGQRRIWRIWRCGCGDCGMGANVTALSTMKPGGGCVDVGREAGWLECFLLLAIGSGARRACTGRSLTWQGRPRTPHGFHPQGPEVEKPPILFPDVDLVDERSCKPTWCLIR
jgi:hypothetical protein